jgi:hypothetical protein
MLRGMTDGDATPESKSAVSKRAMVVLVLIDVVSIAVFLLLPPPTSSIGVLGFVAVGVYVILTECKAGKQAQQDGGAGDAGPTVY